MNFSKKNIGINRGINYEKNNTGLERKGEDIYITKR